MSGHLRANQISLTTRHLDSDYMTGTVTAVVWELSYPIEYDGLEVSGLTKYVQTSGSHLPERVCETFVFACNVNGEWLNGIEQPGSLRGFIDHAEAIRGFIAYHNKEEA